MTAYTAKFSNGTTKSLKNSTREYTHAWIVQVTRGFDGAEITRAGFSGSLQLAEREAASVANYFTQPPRRRFKGEEAFIPGRVNLREVVEVERG